MPDNDVQIASTLPIRPVILSGGGGTRLWPVSRRAMPKQLLPMITKRSMLQETAARFLGEGFEPSLIVTGEEQRFAILEQLTASKAPLARIILEPAARNTAAAIAMACQWSLLEGHDELLLVVPSDHLINDLAAFHSAVLTAAPVAAAGGLVTFGIRPTGAKTGYGYIQAYAREGRNQDLLRVKRFTEKPGAAHAAAYVQSGQYYWNGGIFLFRPSVMLEQLTRHAPEIVDAIAASLASSSSDGPFLRPDKQAFEAAPNVSIDYAVMEKTAIAHVLPVDLGWSDVGAWDAVWEAETKDASGNVLQGDVLALDTSNSIIRCDTDATVAALGLKDIVVIVTRDAAFVCPRDRAEEVKLVVDQLRIQGNSRADDPAQVFRPWGTYETVDAGERFQTKRIIVKPGGTLSLQKHRHRAEHWIVVSGTAEVTVGEKVSLLQGNESTYIPAGEVHRLSNPGHIPLQLIEVQCGPYLGEDDIVRMEDVYGRG